MWFTGRSRLPTAPARCRGAGTWGRRLSSKGGASNDTVSNWLNVIIEKPYIIEMNSECIIIRFHNLHFWRSIIKYTLYINAWVKMRLNCSATQYSMFNYAVRHTTGMHVKVLPEDFAGNGWAFDVPARAPHAPRGVPFRFSRLGSLPQCKIVGVLLLACAAWDLVWNK